MGIFVFLPLVLPLTAWPIARLAERRLHPRNATYLLTGAAGVMAMCCTVCLVLLMVVGTAQLPDNPLPDGWSDEEVRQAVPCDEIVGTAAIPALIAVLTAWARTLARHVLIQRRAGRALTGLPETTVALLPDETPYAYALPRGNGRRGRIVASSGMLARLEGPEKRALFAHELAHLSHRHHRFLLAAQLAARANPFLLPLRTAVAFSTERWADEAAARAIGSRRLMARAVGKAGLVSRGAPGATLAGLARPGPVPRRVAALLGPLPAVRSWPPASTAVGLAVWTAAAGTTMSALSSANSAVTLFFVLKAATPL